MLWPSTGSGAGWPGRSSRKSVHLQCMIKPAQICLLSYGIILMPPHSGKRSTLPAAPQYRGKRNIQIISNRVWPNPDWQNQPPSSWKASRDKKKRHNRSVSLGPEMFFAVCHILRLPVNSEIVELSCETHSDQTVEIWWCASCRGSPF